MLSIYAIISIALVLIALHCVCAPIGGTCTDDEDDDNLCDAVGFISPYCADDLGGVLMPFSSPM